MKKYYLFGLALLALTQAGAAQDNEPATISMVAAALLQTWENNGSAVWEDRPIAGDPRNVQIELFPLTEENASGHQDEYDEGNRVCLSVSFEIEDFARLLYFEACPHQQVLEADIMDLLGEIGHAGDMNGPSISRVLPGQFGG